MRASLLPTILLGLAIAALAATNVALDWQVRAVAAQTVTTEAPTVVVSPQVDRDDEAPDLRDEPAV